MKIIPAALTLWIISMPALAGQFIYPNMYNEFALAQGTGLTTTQAIRDAESAVPPGYQRELKKSGGETIGCTVSEILLRATKGKRCDTHIPGNRVVITFAVTRLTPQP